MCPTYGLFGLYRVAALLGGDGGVIKRKYHTEVTFVQVLHKVSSSGL